MVRRRATVSGRVQGVFFRDTCRRVALANGVAGWVRNRADGSVEAALEGDAAAVEEVLAWMRAGPAGAVVTAVDVRDEALSGDRGFTVR